MRPYVHVLVVEDEPLTALCTARMLRKLPAVKEVTIATDGEEALALLRAGEVKSHHLVILTDLSMPRMNGLELVAAISKIPSLRDQPVAVLTTSIDPRDREAALALHVDGFFVKRDGRKYLDALVDWVKRQAALLVPTMPVPVRA